MTLEVPAVDKKNPCNMYTGQETHYSATISIAKRLKGVEPSSRAWEARVIPLYDSRINARIITNFPFCIKPIRHQEYQHCHAGKISSPSLFWFPAAAWKPGALPCRRERLTRSLTYHVIQSREPVLEKDLSQP